jgi:hypothetical protein
MVRTHLTIELTLGDVENVKVDNFSWILKNFEFVAEMIQLDLTVHRAILEANGGVIVVPYSTYSQQVACTGSGSMSMGLSNPYKSLKSLVAIYQKDEDSYANKTYVSIRNSPIGEGGCWR